MTPRLKTVGLTIGALAVLAVLGGSAVVGFGLYNVSARSGHLPGVSWILHRTYRSAVTLRAPARAEVPGDLESADRIALGARHFASACRFCHAAPGEPQAATAAAMVPRPPHVSEVTEHWEPRHLHWIVWAGVKMSGMPHWPAAGREDEVWSVVAFLDAVPEMDGADYAALTARPGLDDPLMAYCAGCHGAEGATRNAHVPRLDIQGPDYLRQSLEAYRSGRRPSGYMAQAARGLDDAEIARLAEWFAGRAGTGPAPPEGELANMPGARLAERGTTEVPACIRCHGPDAEEVSPAIPALAGQNRAYLEAQLRRWRDGPSGGGPRADLMRKAARALSDAEISALAAWYARLPAARAQR